MDSIIHGKAIIVACLTAAIICTSRCMAGQPSSDIDWKALAKSVRAECLHHYTYMNRDDRKRR